MLGTSKNGTFHDFRPRPSVRASICFGESPMHRRTDCFNNNNSNYNNDNSNNVDDANDDDVYYDTDVDFIFNDVFTSTESF